MNDFNILGSISYGPSNFPKLSIFRWNLKNFIDKNFVTVFGQPT